ncbi:sensor histidine kinase [Psychrobacillus sp. NPDC096426]|uniref:sensor histidine kinase n=1 Tax=Psychrobacillus sp. NPDC096426 TaxID=3364491 RepID=UPI0038016DD6
MKNLKLKMKIVLWATVLMIGLFVSYNILQYFVMNSWMIHYEEQSIEKKMNTIQNYYSNQKLSVQFIKENESFINSINEKSETIRILDKEGKSIVAVSEEELLHVPSQLVQSEQFELVTSGDDRLLVYREPLVDTNYVGTIEIVRNMEIFDGLLEQFSLVMFLTGIGAVFLSLVGALFLSKQIVRPIQAISHSLTRIKKFGLEERVNVPPAQDQISELAIHFNELMDQLEISFNQQKQFVEDASHELRTPLSVLNGNLMMLNRWGKDDREVLNKSLVSSLREVDRMDKLVKDLLELSRLDSEKTVDATIPMINPINVIEKVVNDFEMTHPEFMFSLQLFDGTLLPMKEQHLEQLLTILIDNAIKYSNDDKRVTIHYQHRELTIQDFGIGIPKEDVPHVTDRFYRVEKSRNRKKGGYGIGLSIALKLMETYKGSLVIESQLGKGTSVKLVFPKTKNTKNDVN